MLSRIYLIGGGVLLALYAAVTLAGWEVGSPTQLSPKEAQGRHGPGGSRSYWHSGFRGGK
jgi:hypothetical protein